MKHELDKLCYILAHLVRESSVAADALLKDAEKYADKMAKASASASGKKVFVPPTEEEVAEYCEQRGNGIDAGHFVAFYAAKGWKIGKDPMKDWRAAVRTWEQRNGFNANKSEEETLRLMGYQ